MTSGMAYRLAYETALMEGDRTVLAEGDAALLRSIKRSGSLAQAAKDRGVSYRHAWTKLRNIEGAAGLKVVVSARGGERKGRTALTPEGERLLQEYECRTARMAEQLAHMYKNPILTTDGIVLVDGRIVLVRRGKEPGKGKFALPGGFMDVGERAEECVVREVLEETGLRCEVLDLVGAYSDPSRDPRGHIVSLVFFLVQRGGALRAGDDADHVDTFELDRLPELAFDHRAIIEDFRRTANPIRT